MGETQPVRCLWGVKQTVKTSVYCRFLGGGRGDGGGQDSKLDVAPSPRTSGKTPAMMWPPCRMRRVSCLTSQVSPAPPPHAPTPSSPHAAAPLAQSLGSQETESTHRHGESLKLGGRLALTCNSLPGGPNPRLQTPSCVGPQGLTPHPYQGPRCCSPSCSPSS